ncbi:MAG: flagellar protein FliT [Bdellovibrionales bacterium]
MERLVEFMNERNNYLDRYFKLNAREIELFAENNFDSIDAFYETRSAILEVIHALDERIDIEIKQTEVAAIQALENQVAEILTYKDEVIEKILDQDLEILSLIETEKNSVMQELMSSKKNKKAVGAYKSGKRKVSFQQEA